MMRLVCLAALFAFATTLVGCKTKTPPPAPPPAPAVTVKAGELLKEYSTNAVAADGKYKGKVLAVSGKFNSAQAPVPLMGVAVQLLPEDAGDVNASYVQCFILDSAKDDVGKLQPGQTITMQGTCDGQVLGQVKLSKCTVAK
jgi:hypothetical protein